MFSPLNFIVLATRAIEYHDFWRGPGRKRPHEIAHLERTLLLDLQQTELFILNQKNDSRSIPELTMRSSTYLF